VPSRHYPEASTPFFRLANTGLALECESHGFEIDLVAHT
jgi:hypothetical protein